MKLINKKITIKIMRMEHQNLAAGKWAELTLAEQLANIGSEVERAIKWKEKGNVDYFNGENIFSSSAQLWRKYFYAFNWLARK